MAERTTDSAHGNKTRLMTLPVDEFLRRFLLHLLPRGFVRIRNLDIRPIAADRCPPVRKKTHDSLRWYGQFRLYVRDRDGKEIQKTRKVVVGLKSELRKHEAEQKLREIIRAQNGKNGSRIPVLKSDDSVTFDWFVNEKYLPLRQARWSPATRDKTEFEIKKYLVEKLKGVPLRETGLFELQMVLNKLAESFSESIVKHALANIRSIMRLAHKLTFLEEDPSEDMIMPGTKPVNRPQ